MKLSIIIPAYNEERFIEALIERVLSVDTEQLGFVKEIIVVDDGSRDRTAELARRFTGVTVYQQVPNQGKGRAVQRGIKESKGDLILIQDADLEYDPNDYLPMLDTYLKTGRECAIYGSRILGQIQNESEFRWLRGKHPKQGLGAWLANRILSLQLFVLYGIWLTDLLTAYKIYPGDFLRGKKLKTAGFETDHEITSILLRNNIKIVEVPVKYDPRSAEEGKKIKARDGLVAVLTLLRFRF